MEALKIRKGFGLNLLCNILYIIKCVQFNLLTIPLKRIESIYGYFLSFLPFRKVTAHTFRSLFLRFAIEDEILSIAIFLFVHYRSYLLPLHINSAISAHSTLFKQYSKLFKIQKRPL